MYEIQTATVYKAETGRRYFRKSNAIRATATKRFYEHYCKHACESYRGAESDCFEYLGHCEFHERYFERYLKMMIYHDKKKTP